MAANGKETLDRIDSEQLARLASTRATFAVVCKGPLKDFNKLLELIEIDFPETFIVFKRTAHGKLWIVNDESDTDDNI